MMPMAVASPHKKIRAQVKLKTKKIMEKRNFDNQDVRYILRQIGFGAMLCVAFLLTIYFGGLLARLVSGF
jgi:hypothetical protein